MVRVIIDIVFLAGAVVLCLGIVGSILAVISWLGLLGHRRTMRRTKRLSVGVTAESSLEDRLNAFVHDLDQEISYELGGDVGVIQSVSHSPRCNPHDGRDWPLMTVYVGLMAQLDMPVRSNGFDTERAIKKLRKLARPIAKKYNIPDWNSLDIRGTMYHIGWYAHIAPTMFPIVMVEVMFDRTQTLMCRKFEMCKGLADVVLKEHFSKPLDDVVKELIKDSAESLSAFRGQEGFDNLMKTPIFPRGSVKGWPTHEAYDESNDTILSELYWR